LDKDYSFAFANFRAVNDKSFSSGNGKGFRILVVQTAFLGDAILASSVLETLHNYLPEAQIDFLCTKAASALFDTHPFLNQVLAWDKSRGKYWALLGIAKQIWKSSYTHVVNIQRYTTTGLLTACSGAKHTSGFDKNPLSFIFSSTLAHEIGAGIHEIDRNFSLIASWLPEGAKVQMPKLYASTSQLEKVKVFQQEPYYIVAPASVWATKMWPEERWASFIALASKKHKVYVIGGNSDVELCQRLTNASTTHPVISLAGKLSLIESAILMKQAVMNYVQDSGPVHLASAFNAPVTVIYCSTVPEFGFGPLSSNSRIVEIQESLPCRPCGLHGFSACPLKHFRCGWEIFPETILLDL